MVEKWAIDKIILSIKITLNKKRFNVNIKKV